MQASNELTSKEYWHNNWRDIKLPVGFINPHYSQIVITDLISKYISAEYKDFLEIGGCPGRWAHFFYSRCNMRCDSMDYDENNIKLIKKNYELLGIKGDAIWGDITATDLSPAKIYDIVLSDGLIEHFMNPKEVFKNHVRYLKKNGLLIIGVPNIKKSWFYNFLCKIDYKGYEGYRHVDKEELSELAKENGLKIMFCDYIGVFNLGIININVFNKINRKILTLVWLLTSRLLKASKLKIESKNFSPHIYLIAKKSY